MGIYYLNPNPIHGHPYPIKPENLLFLKIFYWENDKTINVISFLYIPIKLCLNYFIIRTSVNMTKKNVITLYPIVKT